MPIPPEWGPPAGVLKPRPAMNFYKSQYLANDRRVAYINPKWPWIEAVHRFGHPYHRPQSGDFAEFTFPPTASVGQYVIWWYWRGYSDCIDAEYLGATYATPYGIRQSTASNTFDRVDHCTAPEGAGSFSFPPYVVGTYFLTTASSRSTWNL
jgi:hypothetical protein